MIIFNNNSIGYVLDVDASKVIEAVRSTGVTITPAMMHYAHYLISNMKNIGTWQLSNAVYGFVGGTAASHKFNWKDLRDTDAAFRLTFPNGMTHSSNGIQGNGTNQYANTFLNPSVTLSNTSSHLSFYSNLVATKNGSDISTCNSAATGTNILEILSTTTLNQLAIGNNSTLDTLQTNSNKKGFIQSQISGTSLTVNVNDLVFSKTAANALINTTFPLFIGARNSSSGAALGLYSSRPYQSVIIGGAINTTQALQQSQIVTNAQAILNRL